MSCRKEENSKSWSDLGILVAGKRLGGSLEEEDDEEEANLSVLGLRSGEKWLWEGFYPLPTVA